MDVERYMQAFHQVMGGTGVYNNSDALGGVSKLNSFDTALPRGVSSSLAETSIANLGYDSAGNFAPVNMLQQLVAASYGGMPPELVADPNFWDQMQTAQIKAISDDVYAIVYDTNTGLRALQNHGGNGEFHFSLRRLIQAVPQ